MRLAAKLVLLFLIGLLLIVGLFSYLTIQSNRRLAIDEHERYATDLAATIQSTLADRGLSPQELPRFVAQSSGVVQHVEMRWVERNGIGQLSPSAPRELIWSHREVTTFSMPDRAGRPYLYTYVPVGTSATGADADVDSLSGGRIEVAAPDTATASRVRQSLISSLIALLGVATLSGIVIWVGGVNMVGKPLSQLIDKVHRVGEGDFEGPVEVRRGDELGKLALAINGMCEQLSAQRARLTAETASRLQAVEQLRHSERLNSVGRMAAGIAHEIGTPLNVVIGRAQLIRRQASVSQQVASDADVIVSEAQRIADIVRGLLDFTRSRKPHRTIQRINMLLKSTVDLMQPMANKHGASLQLQLADSPLMANIDSAQMQQVWTNLILNAIQSTGENGHVIISAVAANHELHISVADNGVGIPPEHLEHLFEPFFTTKKVGEGTGLGLSISHGIVREHDGDIQVESTVGKGSRFTIVLPAAQSTLGQGDPA